MAGNGAGEGGLGAALASADGSLDTIFSRSITHMIRHRWRAYLAGKISDRLAATLNGCRTDHGKSQRGMERIGNRIGWIGVDLTDDAPVTRQRRLFEQIGVKLTAITATTRGRRDNNTVHIDKSLVTCTKPQEIDAVIISVLVERQKQGVIPPNPSRRERLPHEVDKTFRLQPRQGLCVSVVQRQQVGRQRRPIGQIGWADTI